MKTTWDYTQHAQYYSARPNYADVVIDELVKHVAARASPDYLVADVGAGTGNLTVMLLARGLNCVAVEPNAEMRRFGTERTQASGVRWMVGTGEETGLAEASVNWLTMGSSFNTMDRPRALKEVSRVLKPGGWFTCMWNHRDLDDPVQQEIEALIRKMVPSYVGGTRREDQTEVIRDSGLFGDVVFHEGSQSVKQPVDAYVAAWRSTGNLKIHAGDRFEDVIAAIDHAARARGETLSLKYTTRAWSARKA